MDEKIDVCKISKLAKLNFGESEAARLEGEMREFSEFSRVLDGSFESIGKADVLPMYGREDIAAEEYTDISLFANQVRDGYVCVPLTVEGE